MDANTNDNFLGWLREQVKSEPYKTMYKNRCKKAAEGDHPTTDDICEHILGSLSDEEDQAIMEHIAYCSDCLEMVTETHKVSGMLDDLMK